MGDESPPKRPLRPDAREAKYWEKLIAEKLVNFHESRLINGHLDPHKIFRDTQALKNFYSDHNVHPYRIADNETYARWAIDEALKAYHPDTSFQVTGNIMEGQSVNFGKESVLKSISDALRAEGHQDVDAEDSSNVAKDADSEVIQDVSAVTETIIAASPNSLGPPIEACASYLHMEKCGTFGRNNLTVWKSPLFPQLDGQGGRKGFLDNQITAIVWILANFLGTLPRLKQKLPEYWDQERAWYNNAEETEEEKKHRKMLRRPQYYGAILADSMGLGKTLTTIACLDIMAGQNLNVVKEKGKFACRPILILTPNVVVASQWVDEIEQLGSHRSFRQIITSGDGIQKTYDPKRVRVLSAQDFREWPKDLSYVWNEDNRYASKVVIVISIDTWARRTCTSREEGKDGRDREGNWTSTFADMGRCFSVVVVDEAYKIRHTTTRYWKSVSLLERQFTLLITATPCMNLLTDLLGPVRLLWDKPEEHLQKDGERWAKIDKKFDDPKDLEILDEMNPFDDHQLMAGRPSIIAKLIHQSTRSSIVDVQETRAYLKYFERLAILRRAPSSHLHWDWKGTKLVCLDGLLPNVYNFTVNIQLDRALEKSYQDYHLNLLTHYLTAVKKFGKRQKKKAPDEEREGDLGIGSILTTYLRFELAAASMDVSRLEKLFLFNDFGINSEYVSFMRHNNVDFLHLASFLLGPYDERPKTALAHIKLAVRKSPILRYILHFVKENVLDRKEGEKIKKLLIIESRPILAYYYELVLQFLLINCRTLHAGLSGEQRRELIASFNDDADQSCQILIQMYSVGFAGSNLHKNCSQVLVATQAYSLPIQLQAIHRIIRVGQTKDVRVYRLKVNNSYHDFRESRQVEKILPELGTRAQGSLVEVLVQLLNLFQYEVDEAANSLEGRELMEQMNLLVDEEQRDDEEAIDEEEVINDKEINEEDDEKVKKEPNSDDDDTAANLEAAEPVAKKAKLQDEYFSQTADLENASSGSGVDSNDSGLEHIREKGTAHLFDNKHHKFLQLRSRDDYYHEFRGFSGEVKSHFSHTKNNLRRLLSYVHPGDDIGTHQWTADDLDDSAVLERAMELTLRVRLGAENIIMLPLPQINFTRVPEYKLKRLTMLLGEAHMTSQEVDALIEKIREARARRRDSKDEMRLFNENMTLAEIDEAFRRDVTEGDTKQSRKRKRQEAEEAANAEDEEPKQNNLIDFSYDDFLGSDLEEDWDRSDSEDEEEDDGDRENESAGDEEASDA